MIGRRINERYKILSRIGDGGMSVVYKAQDLILDRLVAVKVLRSDFSSDEAFIRRFRREAESVASLSDPNIVNIYDIGEEEDLYYIVMEYVEGMTLKNYIKQLAPIPSRDAVYILKQIALALEHAHQHGIIHRDVKPQNILIDDKDQVKVTDFGIALAVSSATITFTNSIMGSAHYLSPEQAKGGKATAKSDIYAFGIVMYEMLTGQLPFPGESPVTVALKHLNEPYLKPRSLNPNIPQSLENIIIKSLAKSPESRYDGMGEVYQDLTTALLPDRLNEAPLVIDKNQDSEATKVIPPIRPQATYETYRDPELDSRKPTDHGTKTFYKKRRRGIWIWTSLLAVIILVAVAAIFLIPKFLFVPNVTVPNVEGKMYDQAVEALSKQHLYPSKQTVQNDQPAGIIIQEKPVSGIKVKENSTVTLYVSSGPSKQKMPDYVGNGNDRATLQTLLKQENRFKKVIWNGVHSDTVPKDQVISQTPAAGTEIVPAKTVLTLNYSTGPAKVKVPDLTGQTKDQATKTLEKAGLQAYVQDGDYSETIAKGKVLKTDPIAGQEVQKNDQITVYLSQGPKPKPIDTSATISVDVSSNGSGNGKGHHVVITYTDASHEDAIYKDEIIHQPKTYTIPLTIVPNSYASYKVELDGNTIQQKIIQYSDVQNQNGSSTNSTTSSKSSSG